MSTPTAPNLSSDAQHAAFWLRLFRGGVFEDNFLDVSRVDAGTWDDVRDELEKAGLLSVDPGLKLAGRPYLRLGRATPPASPRGAFGAQLQARYVGVYHAFTMPVRQAFAGQKPAYGKQIMELEEPNFRRAVAWAEKLGDIDKTAEMADVFLKYLDRAGRADDRARWEAWLAGEGPDEVADAPVDEGDGPPPEAPKAAPEPSPLAGLAGRGTGGRLTAMLRGMLNEEPAPPRARSARAAAPPEEPATPEPVTSEPGAAPAEPPPPQPPRESEGTRLQREGTAAVAAGDFARATDLYLRALRSFQDAKDTAGVAETCSLFGAMEDAAGRPDAARPWHDRAKAMRS